jgi:ferric-dicitrate binding protein FerR (iron transport regulator)
VATRLSAYYGTQITVDPAVAHLQPGGAFPLKDLESSLKGIETALSVQVLAVGDGSYRIIGR